MRLPIRHFALIATVLLRVLPATHAAESPAEANKRPQPDRWLLIVDTSSAMERRAQAVEGVVGELLVTGMNSQMQPGAELGIWTYNKELFAGIAPMQTWDPARSNVIAGRTVGFLSKQPYRGKSKAEAVLSELARVVSDSRRLTVVWLSDGSGEKIAGTPFDAQINEAFTKYQPALAKTRMPLVTVLRVYHGKYIGQNISVAPWPIEFPAFPNEPGSSNPVTQAPAPAPAPPVKSIYISREPAKPEALHPPEPAATVETKPDGVQLRPAPSPATNPPAPVPTSVTPAAIVPATLVQPIPVVPPPEPPPQAPPITPPSNEVAAVVTTPAATAATTPTPATVMPQPALAPSTPPPTKSETVTARKWPLILGISFMWLAIFAALTLARQARRAKATSLITRSFERDKR